MPKLDTRALLEERAHSLQKYFGKRGEYSEGKIDFPSAPFACSIAYVSRRSIMSSNYFLSLAAEVSCSENTGNGTSTCFLNRLGKWKLKGKGAAARLGDVVNRLESNAAITKLSRATDLDSIVITEEREAITIKTNLYGGGFSAIMIPPIRFKVGISNEQLANGARLLAKLVEVVAPECEATAG